MFKLDKSNIHGKGIIATEDIPEGIKIGPWVSNRSVGDPAPRYLKNGEWWEDRPLGRWCNHNSTPNTKLEEEDGRHYLISKGISEGEEILVDYRWTKQITGYIDEFIESI